MKDETKRVYGEKNKEAYIKECHLKNSYPNKIRPP